MLSVQEQQRIRDIPRRVDGAPRGIMSGTVKTSELLSKLNLVVGIGKWLVFFFFQKTLSFPVHEGPRVCPVPSVRVTVH